MSGWAATRAGTGTDGHWHWHPLTLAPALTLGKKGHRAALTGAPVRAPPPCASCARARACTHTHSPSPTHACKPFLSSKFLSAHPPPPDGANAVFATQGEGSLARSLGSAARCSARFCPSLLCSVLLLLSALLPCPALPCPPSLPP